MKLVENRRYVETTLQTDEKRFGISDRNAAKIALILSSNLYSNKSEAIVRELAMNAYDSHVAAGTTDIPFEVSTPNSFSSFFVVRDYGTGLSYEDVLNLYSSYGESTKDTSNDFVGAFGLGSKSPFAYAQSFCVSSRFNGKEHHFEAFLDETGMPIIKHLATVDTEVRNGLTVMIPILEQDFREFKEASNNILSKFNCRFTLDGLTQDEVSRLLYPSDSSDSNILVTGSSPNWPGGLYVTNGPFHYKITREVLNKVGVSEDRKAKTTSYLNTLGNSPCIYKAPIGSYSLTASREDFDYTKHTKRFFEKLLDDMDEFISNQFKHLRKRDEETLKEYIQRIVGELDSGRVTIREMIFPYYEKDVEAPFKVYNITSLLFKIDIAPFSRTFLEIGKHYSGIHTIKVSVEGRTVITLPQKFILLDPSKLQIPDVFKNPKDGPEYFYAPHTEKEMELFAKRMAPLGYSLLINIFYEDFFKELRSMFPEKVSFVEYEEALEERKKYLAAQRELNRSSYKRDPVKINTNFSQTVAAGSFKEGSYYIPLTGSSIRIKDSVITGVLKDNLAEMINKYPFKNSFTSNDIYFVNHKDYECIKNNKLVDFSDTLIKIVRYHYVSRQVARYKREFLKDKNTEDLYILFTDYLFVPDNFSNDAYRDIRFRLSTTDSMNKTLEALSIFVDKDKEQETYEKYQRNRLTKCLKNAESHVYAIFEKMLSGSGGRDIFIDKVFGGKEKFIELLYKSIKG